MKRSKYVKKLSQLRAGLHLRIFVNSEGTCMYSVEHVIGRPYMEPWCSNEKLLAVKLKVADKYKQHERMTRTYVSDFGVPRTKSSKVVYPFSNKLEQKLKAMLKRGGRELNREFTEFVYGKAFTDVQWAYFTADALLEQESSRAFERSYQNDYADVDWEEYDRNVHESALRYED